MKRAHAMPAALESAVAVKHVSHRTNEVQFDFAGPKWSFLSENLVTPAHPAWFNIVTFVAIFRGLRARDDTATALAVCRWSCDRRILRPVECSRALVAAEEAHQEQWVDTTLSVMDAQGRIWAKCGMRAKVLGSAAEFAQRRAVAKARVDPSVRESRQGRLIAAALVRGVTTVPLIGDLEDGCSLFVVSKRMAMEEHPYYEGSGDHVNTQMQSDLFLQFCAAVCRKVMGVEADSFVTVASSMQMLRFVEFDVETLLELTETAAATVSDKPFEDTAPFEVAREWSDVECELRVVRAQLSQQHRVCGRFESVLLPLSKSKL